MTGGQKAQPTFHTTTLSSRKTVRASSSLTKALSSLPMKVNSPQVSPNSHWLWWSWCPPSSRRADPSTARALGLGWCSRWGKLHGQPDAGCGQGTWAACVPRHPCRCELGWKRGGERCLQGAEQHKVGQDTAQRGRSDAGQRATRDATVIYAVRACCAREQAIPKQVLPKDDIKVGDTYKVIQQSNKHLCQGTHTFRVDNAPVSWITTSHRWKWGQEKEKEQRWTLSISLLPHPGATRVFARQGYKAGTDKHKCLQISCPDENGNRFGFGIEFFQKKPLSEHVSDHAFPRWFSACF